jgi:hypothetical protein
MTTDNTNADTQNAAPGADTSADASKVADTGTTGTVLTDDASKTAEGVEAGDKSAETGDGDKSKEGEDGADKTDKSKTDDGKADGPPEKYEFTMPEGMELDTALAEKVDPVLRELGLSNEQANKLASTFAEYRASESQRQSDAYAQQVEDWGKSARDDKEFGGAAFEKNVAAAQTAIGKFGTPELKALLADGLGNHPELIRFCVRVGKAIGEDGGVEGNKATTPKDPASVLFDHPTSKPKR